MLCKTDNKYKIVMPSSLLFQNKQQTVILPLVLYGSETRFPILRDEHRLVVLRTGYSEIHLGLRGTM